MAPKEREKQKLNPTLWREEGGLLSFWAFVAEGAEGYRKRGRRRKR